MRRFIPWALLAVLGLGVAGFAALGQVQAPTVTPTQWVNEVLATTSAARTAHFQFSNVITSADPAQRGTTTGTGVVDFTNGDFRVHEIHRQKQLESTNGGPAHLVNENWDQQSIAIGQTLYQRLAAVGPFSGWMKTHFPRQVHQAFGLDAGNGAEDAMANLAGFTPVAAVHRLGSASVKGVAATRYLITEEPLYICGAHRRTLLVHRFAPTTMWVDGQGRLLQVRTSLYNKGGTFHGPPEAGSPPITIPPSTTVSTLFLSDFGAPVHITAPKLNGPHGGSSLVTLKARGSTTPCRG